MGVPFGSILLVSFVTLTSSYLTRDEGLFEACSFMEGKYIQRASGDANVGDTCEMTFRAPTKNQKEADELCGIYAPWRLHKATSGLRTTCLVEATLMCEAGWIQMRGRCYRMPDKSKTFTYPEAEALCAKSNNGKVARLYYRYMVGMWKNYFRGVRQVWTKLPSFYRSFYQYVETQNGKDALAFTGIHANFQVPPNSLIKIAPDHKLQVLCEYTPFISTAEVAYRGRRYSEIYHKNIPFFDGILTRSASQYPRGKAATEICKQVVKPYLVSENDVQPFVPNGDGRNEVSSNKPEGISFARLGGELQLDTKLMKTASCKKTKLLDYQLPITAAQFFKVEFVAPEPVDSCDNMRSTAISFVLGGPSVHTMSDSRDGPVLCKIGGARKYEYVNPGADYHVVIRDNGRKFGHWVLPDEYTFDDARTACAQRGAYLTGFDSIKELQLLEAYLNSRGLTQGQFWVGATRRASCMNIGGYDTNNPNGVCGQARVFEWLDNVATKPMDPKMWTTMNTKQKNPDYAGKEQKCLTIARGGFPWRDEKAGGYFDDVDCFSRYKPICGKYLEVREIGA